MTSRVTILTDNLKGYQKTKTLLEKEGFDVYTHTSSKTEILSEIYHNQPDVVLMDLNLEYSDGIEQCQLLKKENKFNSFVVLSSPHREDYIQIEAFNAGADDYVVTPINPIVLSKRIIAILKRKPLLFASNNNNFLSYKNLKVDKESYLVFNEGVSYTLPKKEFEMLCLLINKPQKVFSREEIFKKVWNTNECNNTRIIDVHITKIRKLIGENIINTVTGVGYQLA
jgi:two-component system alkaline phosphatase synthesis response regulator PhoP